MLFIAFYNNAIWINYVKAKRDKKQKNEKSRLFGVRDETITYVMQQIGTGMTGRENWLIGKSANN